MVKRSKHRGATKERADADRDDERAAPGDGSDTTHDEPAAEPTGGPAEAARERASVAAGDEPEASEVIESLRAELEEVEAEKLRLLAEFRNFRQRMERDRLRIRTDAACGFFASLLPIVHDLERAREAATGDAGDAPIARGIDLVLKRLGDLLRKEGVVEVDPVGEPFDETTMEAMGMIPSDGHPEGHVAQVFQKGLLLGERLIEPARVLVSSGPPGDEASSDGGDSE